MAPGAERPRALPRTVLALGLVSLLTDASSEMIFPLLPGFLAARIGGAPLLIGAMEGTADLIAAACKWWAGKRADRVARLKPMVLVGYSVSTLARPLMAFVVRWWQPLLIRALDRVGKGVRGAPRDALIAHWVPRGARGRAFGFHRAMDHAGAALGAGLAFGLVGLGLPVERVFLLSAIPGGLAVLAIFLAREAPAPERPGRRPPGDLQSQALEPVPRRLFAYLGPVALFALGNATDAFLLLLLSQQGAPKAWLPAAWLLLHVVKAAVSFPAGWIADRLGSARVVLAGWVLYAAAYGLLAFSPSAPFTLAVIALYGLYHALSEGAEKALLADLAPMRSRGRAFGLYHALSGGGALLAGLLFGGLWNVAGSTVAFLTAAGLALTSATLLVLLLPRARAVGPWAPG